jgi:transposase-like protein
VRDRAALVLSLLKGATTVPEAAQAHGLTIGEIGEWLDTFLLGAGKALRSPLKKERTPKDRWIKRLTQKVEELELDLEILKVANKLPSFELSLSSRKSEK